MSVFNYIIFSAIALAGTLVNIFLLHHQVLGAVSGAMLVFLFGYFISSAVFKDEEWGWKLFFTLPISMASIITVATPVYYFYKLDNYSIAAIAIALPLLALFFNIRKKAAATKEKKSFGGNSEDTQIINPGWHAPIYVLLFLMEAAVFFWIFTHGTTDAIRTPWLLLGKKFLVLHFLTSIFLALAVFRSKRAGFNLFFISAHAFITFGLGLLIYKIGYGFDPFIHRATEDLILQTGAVFPKPLYYLGQYSLIVFLSKILLIPVALLDKLLVPVSAAIFLPASIFWGFKKFFSTEKMVIFAPFLLLAVPFTQFVATTPQGLANFFVCLLAFLSFGFIGKKQHFILALFALAAFFIHPLAGIPALFFVAFDFLLYKEVGKFKTIILFIIFLLAIFAVPASFIAKEIITGTPISEFLRIPNLDELNFSFTGVENRYNIFADLLYFYRQKLIYILIILAVVGLSISEKKHKIIPHFLTAIAAAAGGLILNYFIKFPSVINYEQQEYGARLFQLAEYFLLPLCFFALVPFFEKFRRAGRIPKLFFALVAASLLTASLYLTYPRIDRYELSHAINTSANDILTVKKIEEISAGKDYIVLANQAVSAAALQEFGFKKYFKTAQDEMFYYPIPTGGPLYEYYLSMVYKNPSKKTMEEAMKLAGVKQSYFVLNGYWTNSDRILEKAQKEADSWFVISSKDTFKNSDGTLDSQAVFVLRYSIHPVK
jgi:hypothetical protein